MIQALEQFLDAAHGVPAGQAEQLQATVKTANHLLSDLKSVD